MIYDDSILEACKKRTFIIISILLYVLRKYNYNIKTMLHTAMTHETKK